MKYILFISLFNPFLLSAQDSSYVPIAQDSNLNIHESERNYLGINLSPMLSGILSNQNEYDIKLSALYKRNFGDFNIRFSFNYLEKISNSDHDFNMPVLTNDTSIFYRYFNTDYDYFDLRFGFEELRSFSSTRVHIGMDAIFGFGKQISNYFHRSYKIDSSGYYLLSTDFQNHPLMLINGQRVSNYFVSGLDVSFGMDVFLSESFLVTFQLTPQFNYYIFRNDESINDPLEEYLQYGSYADFKLGYFDIQLIYKF
jgi:hypothetical protein